MREFARALQESPAADLMALIPDLYFQEHERVRLMNLKTDAAKHNQQTIYELQDYLRDDSETDLLSVFLPNYTRRLRLYSQESREPERVEKPPENSFPDFREHLRMAKSADIVFPLSGEVAVIISRFSMHPEKPTVLAVQQMLWDSLKIWENPARGVVLKCSGGIAAKVIATDGDYTEYTAMQYLAEKAPEIPAPRPHGMIRLGPFSVVFMTYVPDMTLKEAWPKLSHEQKASVQQQLDDVFRKLRTLQNPMVTPWEELVVKASKISP